MNMSPYVYFVHYTRGDGTGSTSVNLGRPITGWDDIQLITAYLRSSSAPSAVVANYQLLSGPDTCRSCGK